MQNLAGLFYQGLRWPPFHLVYAIWYLKGCLVPPVDDVFAEFKGFSCFPVSGHFPYSRDFVVSLFQDTLTFQKCLETWKTTKSFEKIIIVKDFVVIPVYRHFLDSKVSRNRKTTKPLEKDHFFQGIFLFLHTFDHKKMSRNMRNNKVPWINDFLKGLCRFSYF